MTFANYVPQQLKRPFYNLMPLLGNSSNFVCSAEYLSTSEVELYLSPNKNWKSFCLKVQCVVFDGMWWQNWNVHTLHSFLQYVGV